MLGKDLPQCFCSAHSYESGGCHLGGYVSTQWYKCAECERSAVYIHSCGYGLFFTSTGIEFPDDAFNSYTNESLLPFWRAQQEEDKDRPEGWVKPLFSRVPPELPISLQAFRKIRTSVGDFTIWEYIDHAASAEVEVPPDPMVVKHNAFWAEQIEAAGLDECEEVPNEYGPSPDNKRPWYRTTVNGATLTFGPRKRVYNIRVERDKPFSCAAIREQASVKDNVSFWADDPSPEAVKRYGDQRGMGWKAKVDLTTKVEVHAWGAEKLQEYFALILKGLRDG